MSFPRGLYESLITEELAASLAELEQELIDKALSELRGCDLIEYVGAARAP